MIRAQRMVACVAAMLRYRFVVAAGLLFAMLGCRRSKPTPALEPARPAQSVASSEPAVDAAPSASGRAAPAASSVSMGDASAPLDASSAACPADMAKLVRSCIDRYEAILVLRDDAGTEVRHPWYERPEKGVVYAARSVAGEFPQAYISRVEAAAACKNAGKRLCTMNEWRRGCMGSRWWTWPYGNRPKAGACNNGKPHLLSRMFGSDGKAWKYDEHFNNPALDQEPGFLARGGEYAGCSNVEGIFDMVGNLHEWVSDTVTSELVERMNSEDVERRYQPWREGNGVFLGGFFSTTSEHGPGCRFTTIAHEPSYHDYSIGFRCCLSIPGTKR